MAKPLYRKIMASVKKNRQLARQYRETNTDSSLETNNYMESRPRRDTNTTEASRNTGMGVDVGHGNKKKDRYQYLGSGLEDGRHRGISNATNTSYMSEPSQYWPLEDSDSDGMDEDEDGEYTGHPHSSQYSPSFSDNEIDLSLWQEEQCFREMEDDILSPYSATSEESTYSTHLDKTADDDEHSNLSISPMQTGPLTVSKQQHVQRHQTQSAAKSLISGGISGIVSTGMGDSTYEAVRERERIRKLRELCALSLSSSSSHEGGVTVLGGITGMPPLPHTPIHTPTPSQPLLQGSSLPGYGASGMSDGRTGYSGIGNTIMSPFTPHSPTCPPPPLPAPRYSNLYILWVRFDEEVMKPLFGGSRAKVTRSTMLHDIAGSSVMDILTSNTPVHKRQQEMAGGMGLKVDEEGNRLYPRLSPPSRLGVGSTSTEGSIRTDIPLTGTNTSRPDPAAQPTASLGSSSGSYSSETYSAPSDDTQKACTSTGCSRPLQIEIPDVKAEKGHRQRLASRSPSHSGTTRTGAGSSSADVSLSGSAESYSGWTAATAFIGRSLWQFSQASRNGYNELPISPASKAKAQGGNLGGEAVEISGPETLSQPRVIPGLPVPFLPCIDSSVRLAFDGEDDTAQQLQG